jgi:hypothetical protein
MTASSALRSFERCPEERPGPDSVDGGSSAFRGLGSAWRPGQTSSGTVAGGGPLGPFVHLPAHFPELVGQLTQAGSDLFFCGTVAHGGVVYRYEVTRTRRELNNPTHN